MNPEPRSNLAICNTETFSLARAERVFAIRFRRPDVSKRLALKSLKIKDLVKSWPFAQTSLITLWYAQNLRD